MRKTMTTICCLLLAGNSLQAAVTNQQDTVRNENAADIYIQQVIAEETILQAQNPVSLPQGRNVIKLSGGPGFITTSVVTPEGAYSSRTGTDVLAEFEHIWYSGWGLGLNYAHNSTDYDGYGLSQNYFGASAVLSHLTNKSFRWELAFGLGLAQYTEENPGYSYDGKTENGLGFMSKIGCEYLFHRHLSIGVELNVFTATFPKQNANINEDNYVNGFKRISIVGGLRYHF